MKLALITNVQGMHNFSFIRSRILLNKKKINAWHMEDLGLNTSLATDKLGNFGQFI